MGDQPQAQGPSHQHPGGLGPAASSLSLRPPRCRPPLRLPGRDRQLQLGAGPSLAGCGGGGVFNCCGQRSTARSSPGSPRRWPRPRFPSSSLCPECGRLASSIWHLFGAVGRGGRAALAVSHPVHPPSCDQTTAFIRFSRRKLVRSFTCGRVLGGEFVHRAEPVELLVAPCVCDGFSLPTTGTESRASLEMDCSSLEPKHTCVG